MEGLKLVRKPENLQVIIKNTRAKIQENQLNSFPV